MARDLPSSPKWYPNADAKALKNAAQPLLLQSSQNPRHYSYFMQDKVGKNILTMFDRLYCQTT